MFLISRCRAVTLKENVTPGEQESKKKTFPFPLTMLNKCKPLTDGWIDYPVKIETHVQFSHKK